MAVARVRSSRGRCSSFSPAWVFVSRCRWFASLAAYSRDHARRWQWHECDRHAGVAAASHRRGCLSPAVAGLLPSQPILVITRADGSGTSAIVTRALQQLLTGVGVCLPLSLVCFPRSLFS